MVTRRSGWGGRQEGTSEMGMNGLGVWNGTTGSPLLHLSLTHALRNGQVSQRHFGNFQVLGLNLLDAYCCEGYDRGGVTVPRAVGAPRW